MNLCYMAIPYKLHGRDFEGADCYGLVYLYLKEFGYTLPKYEISYTLGTAEQIIAQEYSSILDTQCSIQEHAIVLFYRGGHPTHIGVVAEGKILHTTQRHGVVLEPLKSILRRYTKVEFYSVNKSYYTAQSV